jgi:hypothetical protein
MSSVLVPALVAAVVTLGIEFFAKPSLEARKDRIVDRYRGRRAAKTNLRALSFRYGQLIEMLENPVGARIEHTGDEVNGAIRERVDALVRSLADGGEALDHDDMQALSSLTAGWAAYLHLSDHHEPHDGLLRFLHRLEPIDDAVNEVFALPRWRRVARRRAVRLMHKVIEQPS